MATNPKIERLTRSKQRVSDMLFAATIEYEHKRALVEELRFLEKSLQELINLEIEKNKKARIVVPVPGGPGTGPKPK